MQDKELRHQLIKHLKGGEAFMPIEEVLDKIDYGLLHIVPEGLPYSFYQLFYHIRLSQYDILEFARNPQYQSPEWPDGYWPENKGPKDEIEWKELQNSYFDENNQLASLILDASNDLFKPIPHGTGQNLLREALLVIEHSAYHIGQLLVVLRLLKLHD